VFNTIGSKRIFVPSDGDEITIDYQIIFEIKNTDIQKRIENIGKF
jgi:hypothetical protein